MIIVNGCRCLHMTLRITDKLFEMLLFRSDELEKNNKSFKSDSSQTEIFRNFL